jgi:predicted ester cyclase
MTECLSAVARREVVTKACYNRNHHAIGALVLVDPRQIRKKELHNEHNYRAEQSRDPAFLRRMERRQPDAFDDLIAPDVVRHCEATPGVEAQSLDQVKKFLRQNTAVFPDSVQTIKLLVAEGNLIAAWTTYEGTQQGPMGPFPPSGRKAKFDFGAVFRIEGGKIAEWWVTWDNMTILRALGHLPSI